MRVPCKSVKQYGTRIFFKAKCYHDIQRLLLKNNLPCVYSIIIFRKADIPKKYPQGCEILEICYEC